MTAPRLTGRHVLFLFGGFFLTVIGVNVAMVTLALDTFTGTDVDGAYVKGLNYNAAIEQRALEASYGYEAALEVTRDAAGNARIAARYAQGGAAADGLTVEALLRHPVNAHLDRTVALAAKGGGLYEAETADLPAGQWDVALTARDRDRIVLEAKKRVWLR